MRLLTICLVLVVAGCLAASPEDLPPLTSDPGDGGVGEDVVDPGPGGDEGTADPDPSEGDEEPDAGADGNGEGDDREEGEASDGGEGAAEPADPEDGSADTPPGEEGAGEGPEEPRAAIACTGDGDRILCEFTRQDSGASARHEYAFEVPEGIHWICFEWSVTRGSGFAKLAVELPDGGVETLAAYPGAAREGETMIEAAQAAGTWRIVVDLTEWSGSIHFHVDRP